MQSTPICSFPECTAKHVAKGLCTGHYQQQKAGQELRPLRKWGTPEERFWSFVNKGDGCWNWTGSVNPLGYATIWVNSARVPAHRFSWSLANGPIPDGMLIDHICHNPSCVNPRHLRLATKKQNVEYRAGAQCNSSSGVRNVYWNKKYKKWNVVVKHYGKPHYFGTFETIEEAEQAARQARAELFSFPDLDKPMETK